MAWQAAGYGIAASAVAVAIALVFALASLTRAARRIDEAAAAVSKEAEAALRSCVKLADEARETIALTRHGAEGFSALAEGARAWGEASRHAAGAAIQLTERYRDFLSAPFRSAASQRQRDEDAPVAEICRKLWTMWKRRADSVRVSSDRRPGTGEEHATEGE
ncbi:hypothetical protein [Cohnella boryungensis]|uniref:DUF948 domain-containing protein n=1 Tax=Cohnella boryungensis TaxID=768479 RepID=A0ABV8SEL3_9BACL